MYIALLTIKLALALVLDNQLAWTNTPVTHGYNIVWNSAKYDGVIVWKWQERQAYPEVASVVVTKAALEWAFKNPLAPLELRRHYGAEFPNVVVIDK